MKLYNKRIAYLTTNIPLIKADLAIIYPVEAINRDFLHLLTSYYMQPSDLNNTKEYINGRDKRLKQVEEELEQDDDYDM